MAISFITVAYLKNDHTRVSKTEDNDTDEISTNFLPKLNVRDIDW